METFPGFPEEAKENMPSFPEHDAAVSNMVGWTASQVLNAVGSLSSQDMILLFFATFYRPFDVPKDVGLSGEAFDAEAFLAKTEFETSDAALDGIRDGVIQSRRVQVLDLLKWAVWEYPKALEWFRARGFLNTPKTTKINTKLVRTLSEYVRTPALDAFASIVGYAVATNTGVESLADIIVAGYALEMPNAVVHLLKERGVEAMATRKILTEGPATAVPSLLQAVYPEMLDYITDWNQRVILSFMSMVNGILKEHKFNPETRRALTPRVRDVHLHAALIKDELVMEATSNWVSEDDPLVQLFRGTGEDEAMRSGDPFDKECRDPMDAFAEAVVRGNVRKHKGEASVESTFECLGITKDVALQTSFDDPRMVSMAERLLDLFESDTEAIHPNALSFALDFANDFARYRGLSVDPGRRVKVGGKEWSREAALDVYFAKSVFVMAPDIEQSPIEHFRKISKAGDDSTPGAEHLFEILVRHFGIVLVNGFDRTPTKRVASELLDACSRTKRPFDTPGGVVIRTLQQTLLRAYPELGTKYVLPEDRSGVHWFIPPLQLAAASYREKWKPDTDWLTRRQADRLVA